MGNLNEPWRDKQQMYEWYVTKRMKLTDIQKLLKVSYGKEISPQALYNWCKKHDLLKYRGKGRQLKANKMPQKKQPVSPMEKKLKEMRKAMAARKKAARR